MKELVEAKVDNLPIPKDEAPAAAKQGKVVNLMEALRASLGSEAAPAKRVAAKKPPKSEKEPTRRGIGLVKGAAKSASRRKSA